VPLVGSTRVRISGDLYEPEGDETAFIFAILGRSHVCAGAHDMSDPTPRDLVGAAVPLADLAAWCPSTPASVLLRRGSVAALGWDHETGDHTDALSLGSSPVSWAAADFHGIVVIDWPSICARLFEWRDLVVETVELGVRIEAEIYKARRRLTPRGPRISVLRP
jgi:hypothetical protein